MAIVRTQVRLKFPGGSRGGTNTWHIRTSGTDPIETSVGFAMSKLKDFYQAFYSDAMSSNFTASWDGSGTTVEASPQNIPAGDTWSVTGTGSAGPGPAGVGLVVGWRSSLASRSGRGRTFLSPLTAGVYDGSDGSLTPTILANTTATAMALVSASLTDNGWAFGVYSPTDNLLRDFVGVKIADKVAYLSSRRD